MWFCLVSWSHPHILSFSVQLHSHPCSHPGSCFFLCEITESVRERSHLIQTCTICFWKSMCALKQTVLCNVLPCDIHALCLKQALMSCGHMAEHENPGSKMWHVSLLGTGSWKTVTWCWTGMELDGVGRRKGWKRWRRKQMREMSCQDRLEDSCPNTERGTVKSLWVCKGLWPCSTCISTLCLDPVEMDCSSHLT